MGFNSRTREGCDTLHNATAFDVLKFQFTHPGGVRLFSFALLFTRGMFQFTHPGGVRHDRLAMARLLRRFQFTHPGGVRHVETLHVVQDVEVSIHAPGRGATESKSSSVIVIFSFNSRTREGCDNV